MKDIQVVVADASHEKYVDTILKTIEDAAKIRGTGIAKRTHEYLTTKMKEAKAVIALCGDEFAGFSLFWRRRLGWASQIRKRSRFVYAFICLIKWIITLFYSIVFHIVPFIKKK